MRMKLNTKSLPVMPMKNQECLVFGFSVNRTLLHVLLVIASYTPLVALVADMVQRYPLDMALIDITLVDAVLLIAAISLPVFVLSRLGVDWRAHPEENY